jgi:hypothetical protein
MQGVTLAADVTGSVSARPADGKERRRRFGKANRGGEEAMYPFSEFDLPEELRPRAEARKNTECTSRPATPRCLGGLLEEMMLEEMDRRIGRIGQLLEESTKR